MLPRSLVVRALPLVTRKCCRTRIPVPGTSRLILRTATTWTPKIPKDKLTYNFSRSSGPGGQNVNKVNTKAEIRFHLDEADWIPDEVKQRLREKNGARINRDGEFIVVSSRYRYQEANLRDCFEKLEEMLTEAAEPPKERIFTVPPEWVCKVRIKEKRIRSVVKQLRKVSRDDW